MAGSGTLADIMNPNQFSTGIMPTPGTYAYESMLRNVMNAKPQAGVSQSQAGELQSRALNSYNTLNNNLGMNYGLMGRYTNTAPMSGDAGGGGGGSSSSSSSMSTGAGLMEEILGLIRGTGEKQYNTARSRLASDYGTAREQKMADLARRGLFRAGSGEREIQQEIEKPFSRGMADLEGNMADANTDLALRKAGILGDIEAQARRAQAEAQAQNMAMSNATGTGAYTMNPSAGYDSRSGSGTEGAGGGGIFGAQFVDARKQQAQGNMTPEQVQAGLKNGSLSHVFPQNQGSSYVNMGAQGGYNSWGGGSSGDTSSGTTVPQLGIAKAPTMTGGYKPVTNAYTGQQGYRAPSGAWVSGTQMQQMQTNPYRTTTAGGYHA